MLQLAGTFQVSTNDLLERCPRTEDETVELTVEQAIPINFSSRRAVTELGRQARVLMNENPGDVVPRSEARIEYLLYEQFDDSCFKRHLAPDRQVEHLPCAPLSSKVGRGLLVFQRHKTLVLRDSIRILKVANEIDDHAVGLPNIPSQASPELLAEDPL